MAAIHSVKSFDAQHETRESDAHIDERVARVPLFRYELPSQQAPSGSGTSLFKFEPQYVEKLILKQWEPRFKANPSLKPIRTAVDDYLPQWRDITSIDEERSRLAETYGTDRTGVAWVDLIYPGERLWDEIKKCGQFITRRTGTFHSSYVPGTEQKIPDGSTSYDLLSTDDLIVKDVDPEGEIVETEQSQQAKEEEERSRQARIAANAERQRKLAERMAKDKARQDRFQEAAAAAQRTHETPAPQE